MVDGFGSFNTNNVPSIETLGQLGVEQATLSDEFNQKQINIWFSFTSTS